MDGDICFFRLVRLILLVLSLVCGTESFGGGRTWGGEVRLLTAFGRPI